MAFLRKSALRSLGKLAAIAACRAELRAGKAGKEHVARNVGGRPQGESPLSFLEFLDTFFS